MIWGEDPPFSETPTCWYLYLGYCPKGTQLFPLVFGVGEWHAQMFQADIAAGGGTWKGSTRIGRQGRYLPRKNGGGGGSCYTRWAPAGYKCMI